MNTTHALEQIFQYQGRTLRTLQLQGESWFVAVDVCKLIGLSQVTRAVQRLDPDEVRLIKVTHPKYPGQSITVNAVNEAGLNQLILSGNKPVAKTFHRWLTHEVIPALRRSGYYQMEPTGIETEQLPRFTRRDLLNLALAAENECEELRQENAVLLPKADAYDRTRNCTDSYSLGETAKLLGIPEHGRNNLVKFLRRDGILMANNVAMQRYIDRGYFHIVQHDYFAADGTPHVKAVTRVYVSGIEFVRQRMENYIHRQLAKRRD